MSKAVLLVNLYKTRWVESDKTIFDMLLLFAQFSEDTTVNSDGNVTSKGNGLLQ